MSECILLASLSVTYPLEEIMPVQNTGEEALVSGYDMNNVAELMVKFDILGLRTLSVVNDVANKSVCNVRDIDVEHPSIYCSSTNSPSSQGSFPDRG